MQIMICPHCSFKVVPTAEGLCPACRCVADPDIAVAAVEDDDHTTEDSLPEVDYDQLRSKHRTNNRLGYLMLTVAIFWLAVGCTLFLVSAWLFYEVFVLESPAFQGPPGSHSPKPRVFVSIFLMVTCLPFYLGCKCLYWARRRFQRDARLVMLDDPRAPVLYLRSFKDDESRHAEFGRKVVSSGGTKVIVFQRRLEEERLARTLNRCMGPVIAIGRPGEPLPELGAHRLYVSDEHWKTQVFQLLEKSQLVVMRVGASGGVWWELKKSIDRLPPEKIVLYSEPPQPLPPIFLRLLPENARQIPPSRFVYFDTDWKARCAEGIDDILLANNAFKPTWYERGNAGLVYRMCTRCLRPALIVTMGSIVSWILFELFFLFRGWP